MPTERLLAALGLPEKKITKLVITHVASKWCLYAVDESYSGELSHASKNSLRFQCGPMG